MKKVIFIFCSALFFMNCSGENGSVKDDANTKFVENSSEEWEKRRYEEADKMWELGKKRYPSSTYDLVHINGDTLVAATQYFGVILTTDAGRTWRDVAVPGRVNELTLDKNKRLWGLKSWRGVHELGFCFVYLSNDLGKSWTKFELETKEVFPKTFYSKPYQPLSIIDYQGKVFQLRDVNHGLSWTLIDSVSESKENSSTPTSRTTVVTDTQGREWAFNRQGIFLISNDTIKVY